jgi:hypothetical protein
MFINYVMNILHAYWALNKKWTQKMLNIANNTEIAFLEKLELFILVISDKQKHQNIKVNLL